MMKKCTIVFICCLIFILSGCQKKKENLNSLLIGEWELIDYDISTKSITIGEEEIAVFITFFKEDNKFNLRQFVGDGPFKTYSGTWSLAGHSLSGKYDDQTPWGETYIIDIVDDILIMTPSNGSEKYTYKKTQ